MLFQVAHGAAADVWLGHLVHADGRYHAGVDFQRLERGLHRQRVHHRGQHAHVIGSGAFHALGRALQAAEDVATADDHADLDAHLVERGGELGHAGLVGHADQRAADTVGVIGHGLYSVIGDS